MARAASFCGVILAAGASSRMGRDKALLPWPPGGAGTFLSAAMEMLAPHTELLIVVAGANAPSLEPVVSSRGAYLAPNPEPERGQLSSLQIGLQEVLNRGRDTALVTLVDRPPASHATVAKLRSAYMDASGDGWAVVPEFAGRHGHPVVMGRDLIGAMLRAPVTSTARDVEHANQAHILYLPVDDANVVANVNTPEEYAQLKS